MSGTAQRKGREKNSDSEDKESDGFLRLEEPFQHLLPGIFDEITEDVITPKLSWGTRRVLSLVNCAWKQAFQSRVDARVPSLATEKVVQIERLGLPGVGNGFVFRLISAADGFKYNLPPIPNVGTRYGGTGFPDGCACIFLDGKVYAFGGDKYDGNVHVPGDEVYVMDLAGARQWEQRKSMQYAARCERVRVVRGKIFVHGYEDGGEDGREDGDEDLYRLFDDYLYRLFDDLIIQVYDPESNTWDLCLIF